ncbi:MAG TPA: fused response regulator/phosphatase [bacterium]|nr:fused response regulator/phosphatase [bacterium]
MKKNKILIVDDVLENRLILATILKNRTDYELYFATNGEDVISNISEIMPDLILLDIMMPGLNGFEVAKILKSKETIRDIPIIFISALESINDKIKAFENGGIDYITKPFNSEEVLTRINAHIKLKNYYDEIQRLNNEIKEELELANKIQKSILKENILNFTNIKFYSKFIPYEKISGDFFDIIELSKNNYLFILTDITGHGISAAFYTMIIKTIFYYLGSLIVLPNTIMNTMNNDLMNLLLQNYYPSAFIGFIDVKRKILKYSNAGHICPLLFSSNKNEIIQLDKKNILLGVEKNFDYELFEINLSEGDKFFLFTDGLIENISSMEQIKSYIKNNINNQLEKIVEGLIEYNLNLSQEKKFYDDVTILSFEIK